MNIQYRRTRQPQEKRLKIDNFLGVDYANSKINASPFRATEMRNYIHEAGVNHKRNGWNEIAKFGWDIQNDIFDPKGTPLPINGFWSYVDSLGNNHIIVHAGRKIFKINHFEDNSFATVVTDITETNTYYPSYSNLSAWKTNIVNGIQDKKSYGIVKGDRLYILAGAMFLVYGTWNNGLTYELRAVEDNIDTYIPTTTISISAIGSVINTRQAHDEVNMLSVRRRNKLIGEKVDSELLVYQLTNYPLSSDWFLNRPEYSATYNMGFSLNQLDISNVVGVQIDITDGTNTYSGKIRIIKNIPATYDETITIIGVNGTGVFTDYVSQFDMSVNYTNDNKLSLTMAFGKITNSSVINCKLIRSLSYQLDVSSITAQTPRLIVNGDEIAQYTDFFGDLVTPSINANGIITFETNFPPLIEGQSNIIVEFTKEVSGNANKINNCRFGIIFGYNDIENLFISGNDFIPNYDFHSSYPDSSETQSRVPFTEDLTYFPDNGYAMLGSIQSKIMGYTLLGDGTLAIHKEANKTDPAIYLRTSYIDDVLDLTGKVVVDINGNPYKKVYYNQFAGSIGEGMLSRFASSNLAGDNLILSKNGVFGISLNDNIKSNERFARERSRLINPRLLKETNLENACGISYDNKYYLSINGNCYVMDARFKNQLQSDMKDTYSYECWVWDNVPVRIWFIYNDNLAFGTNDGQICIFDNDGFVDKTYISIFDGGLMYDFATNTFTISMSYNEYIEKLKEGDGIRLATRNITTPAKIGELVLDNTQILTCENGVIGVNFETFYSTIRLYENSIVYIDNLEGYINTPYVIKNLDNNAYTFELHTWNENPDLIALDTTINSITIKLVHLIENETVYLKNIDYALGTFQIGGKIVNSETGELDVKTIYSYPNSATPFISQDLIGYFDIKTNIQSYWATPIFDLGTAEYSKDLKSITLTPEAMISGEIEFGFTTRHLGQEFEIEGVNLFDFNNIDFTKFTFETSTFAKSFTKKLRTKNINFIMFYFRSNNAQDCVVNYISITYEIGRLNKGVK